MQAAAKFLDDLPQVVGVLFSIIRRASSERDSLGGGSSLSTRGLSGGFMSHRSVHDQRVH